MGLPGTARTLAEALSATRPSAVYERIAWEIGKLCRQMLE